MPIAYRYDPAFEGMVLTVSGVMAAPERGILVRVAEFLLSDLGIRNVLVDFSGLTKDGNIEEAFAFGNLLVDRVEIFRGLRMALLPAPNFFYIPSVAAGAVRESGITVVEFDDERSARAWLAEGRQAA